MFLTLLMMNNDEIFQIIFTQYTIYVIIKKSILLMFAKNIILFSTTVFERAKLQGRMSLSKICVITK